MRSLQIRRQHLFALLVLFAALAIASPARAVVVLYSQAFNTDTATAGTTYNPPFTFSGPGTAQVVGGVLELNPGGSGSNFNRAGFSGDILIEGQSSGKSAGAVSGSSRVEFNIGGVRALYHSGYPDGAFRFEGNVFLSNQNFGWTPAFDVLHSFKIRQYGNGNFDVSVIDGVNPLSPVFTRSFFDLASVGQPIGFRYVSAGTGIFDNLSIRYAADLTANPAVGSLIDMGATGVGQPITLTDFLLLQNNGLAASTLQITGISITGPQAGLFAVPDFAPTALTVGGVDTTDFSLSFLGGGAGISTAQLTILTDIGPFVFDLQATSVPEPSTLALGLGMMGLAVYARRRRAAT